MSNNPPNNIGPLKDPLAEPKLEQDFFGKPLEETPLEGVNVKEVPSLSEEEAQDIDEFFNHEYPADTLRGKWFEQGTRISERMKQNVEAMEKRLEADGGRFETLAEDIAKKREAEEATQLAENLKEINAQKRGVVKTVAKNLLYKLETSPLPKLNDAKIDKKAERNLAKEKERQERLAGSMEAKLQTYEQEHPDETPELLEPSKPIAVSKRDSQEIRANAVKKELYKIDDELRDIFIAIEDMSGFDKQRGPLFARQEKLEKKRAEITARIRNIEQESDKVSQPEPTQPETRPLSLSETLEARLAVLTNQKEQTDDLDEDQRLQQEIETVKQEMVEARTSEETSQRLVQNLRTTETAVAEAQALVNPEAYQAWEASVALAKQEIDVAEKNVANKTKLLLEAEALVKNFRSQLKEARALTAPKHREPIYLNDDPTYQGLLEDTALEYLKTHDTDWFNRNFNGKRDRQGHLLDTDGEPTPFLPSQNVTSGHAEISAQAKEAFAKAQPDRAVLYAKREKGSPRILEGELRKAHKKMLDAKKNLDQANENLVSKNTVLETRTASVSDIEGGPALKEAQTHLKEAQDELTAWDALQGTDTDPLRAIGAREADRAQLNDRFGDKRGEALDRTISRLSDEQLKEQTTAFETASNGDKDNPILKEMLRRYKQEGARRNRFQDTENLTVLDEPMTPEIEGLPSDQEILRKLKKKTTPQLKKRLDHLYKATAHSERTPVDDQEVELLEEILADRQVKLDAIERQERLENLTNQSPEELEETRKALQLKLEEDVVPNDNDVFLLEVIDNLLLKHSEQETERAEDQRVLTKEERETIAQDLSALKETQLTTRSKTVYTLLGTFPNDQALQTEWDLVQHEIDARKKMMASKKEPVEIPMGDLQGVADETPVDLEEAIDARRVEQAGDIIETTTSQIPKDLLKMGSKRRVVDTGLPSPSLSATMDESGTVTYQEPTAPETEAPVVEPPPVETLIETPITPAEIATPAEPTEEEKRTSALSTAEALFSGLGTKDKTNDKVA